MIEVFLKGLGVGFAVAAPVGPMALLTIRRTITRGWGMGLATGLGIAGADGTYGLMVAAGLAATGLLVAYAAPMQLIGGLVIALLGTLSIRAFLHPGPEAKPAEAGTAKGVGTAFASAYLLTLSNPMTILSFAALVAGLGAVAAATPGSAYVLVLGVFAGSLLWWLLLVSIAAAAKTRITPQVTRWLDLASGAVLLVWGLKIAFGAL